MPQSNTGADFQAMLRKFMQYAQQNPGEFSGGPQLNGIGRPPVPQMPTAPGQGGIGSDVARGGGIGMPQNVPLPQARPPMPNVGGGIGSDYARSGGVGVPQQFGAQDYSRLASAFGPGTPGGPPSAGGTPGVPMPQPRPNIPQTPPFATMTPPQQGAPQGLSGLFQRSAAMQIDPNTGQPIDPQAAALAQALMQKSAQA